MSEGELKKRIEEESHIIENLDLEYIEIDSMNDILDEAKAEIPHTHPCYSSDEFDVMSKKYREDVLAWFKKWFGTLEK
jgi:hypothetical protein